MLLQGAALIKSKARHIPIIGPKIQAGLSEQFKKEIKEEMQVEANNAPSDEAKLTVEVLDSVEELRGLVVEQVPPASSL